MGQLELWPKPDLDGDINTNVVGDSMEVKYSVDGHEATGTLYFGGQELVSHPINGETNFEGKFDISDYSGLNSLELVVVQNPYDNGEQVESFGKDIMLKRINLNLSEPFGNSTEGAKVYDSDGNVLDVADLEGNVFLFYNGLDTLFVGGEELFPGKIPINDTGEDIERKVTVLKPDYPMKYLIKFQNYANTDIDNPNNFAYVCAWDTSLVNADSTLKNVKYVNVPDEKLEDFVSYMANINENLKIAGSKHLYPMPDSTNLFYREINSELEEATLRDSLRNDPNTALFYLAGEHLIFPGSSTNDKPNREEGPHYATKGRFNTSQTAPEETFFEEASTTILMMNGESMDNGWLYTIFGGAGVYKEFKTLMDYNGGQVIAEKLMVTARDNLEPSTLLKPHEIIYLPNKE